MENQNKVGKATAKKACQLEQHMREDPRLVGGHSLRCSLHIEVSVMVLQQRWLSWLLLHQFSG